MVNEEQIGRLPVRARAALALAAARSAARTLTQAEPDVLAAVESALGLAWRWTALEGIPARELYEQVHAVLGLEPLLGGDERLIASLFAAVTAMYYVTWHADRHEREQGGTAAPRLPNDMAEVGEEFVAETLQYAARAAENSEEETNRQNEVLARLLRDYPVEDPSTLGPAVAERYFDAPCEGHRER